MRATSVGCALLTINDDVPLSAFRLHILCVFFSSMHQHQLYAFQMCSRAHLSDFSFELEFYSSISMHAVCCWPFATPSYSIIQYEWNLIANGLKR